MGRTIIIGDIHGCYDELTQLLNKLRLEHDDRVVAVGDLTVKGPKSAEVLNLFANDSRFTSRCRQPRSRARAPLGRQEQST